MNRIAHLSSTGLDNSHDQIPLYHPPQPIANTTHTNLPTPTNTPQATGLNVPKAISAMASNIDRSTFRQQPPPMKVMPNTIQSNINHFFFVRLVNRVNNKFIVMLLFVQSAKLKVVHGIQKNPNVVTLIFILEEKNLNKSVHISVQKCLLFFLSMSNLILIITIELLVVVCYVFNENCRFSSPNHGSSI